MSKNSRRNESNASVIARPIDGIEKTTVIEENIPDSVGVDISSDKTNEVVTSDSTVESSTVESFETKSLKEAITEENVSVDKTANDEIAAEPAVSTNDTVEPAVIDMTPPIAVETVVVEEPAVIDMTPPAVVEMVKEVIVEPAVNNVVKEEAVITNALLLSDNIVAQIRNVPGKSGKGSFVVEDLLKYQFIVQDAEIMLPESLKRPFLILLKTTKSINKLPVIFDGVRANAVRKFCAVNRISVIK